MVSLLHLHTFTIWANTVPWWFIISIVDYPPSAPAVVWSVSSRPIPFNAVWGGYNAKADQQQHDRSENCLITAMTSLINHNHSETYEIHMVTMLHVHH